MASSAASSATSRCSSRSSSVRSCSSRFVTTSNRNDDEPVDDLAQAELARHAVDDHGHVDADRHAQAGLPHQVGDQLRHVATALAADLHAQSVAVGEVLRQLGDVGDLLGARRAHHLGHDLVGRDAVRQLGHDDRLEVSGQLLDVVLALQPERALAARVRLGELRRGRRRCRRSGSRAPASTASRSASVASGFSASTIAASHASARLCVGMSQASDQPMPLRAVHEQVRERHRQHERLLLALGKFGRNSTISGRMSRSQSVAAGVSRASVYR